MEIDCATTIVLTDCTFKSKKETSCYPGGLKCLPSLFSRAMIDFFIISGLILRLGS